MVQGFETKNGVFGWKQIEKRELDMSEGLLRHWQQKK